MPDINISIENKIAIKTDDTEYICDNNDYVVKFSFDTEWDAYSAKTARFIYNDRHEDIVFTGNQCAVPKISDTYFFNIGVFAGDLHTTTPARVPCKLSVLCGAGAPAAPTQDVYNQLLAKLNELGGVSPDDVAQAVADYLKDNPVDVPTKTSELENDSGFLTKHQDISDKQDKSTLEADVAAKGFTKNTGTYSKPTGGIPKADLASAVQASLGKADSALQSVPSTYRTASAQDKIDSGKVDKVTGKGLSTNDYTAADKAKVDALAAVATSGSYNDLTDKPTITSVPTETIQANANARHEHTNKTVIDLISEAVKAAWDTASAWVTTNGANVLSHLSDSIKHITAAERTAWNAKQDKLIAGDNIAIAADGKTISAAGGFVIDYSNPATDDYTNAVAAFDAGMPVYLKKGSNELPMTGYDSAHCYFGGSISSYLPGGYVNAVYAHIGPNGENYYWYSYKCAVEAAGLYSADAGDYYSSTNVMGQLQEAGAKFNTIPTDEHINSLINAAVGVIENGSY